MPKFGGFAKKNHLFRYVFEIFIFASKRVKVCQYLKTYVFYFGAVIDVLLCHDDELDTRRFAFVLYLVQPWTLEDGGHLDLFNMDGRAHRYFAYYLYLFHSFTSLLINKYDYFQMSVTLSSFIS